MKEKIMNIYAEIKGFCTNHPFYSGLIIGAVIGFIL